MRRLTAFTVCVSYADLLAKSLSRWHIGSDRLVVITAPKDKDTQDLCKAHNVETHVTNVFFANGAKFNKGAAMAEGIFVKRLREDADWLLTFDSDIVPPENWRDQLDNINLHPGKLYGAWRYMQPEHQPVGPVNYSQKMRQGWVLGFFSLFHASDPKLPKIDEPLFDICWPHAGNYDTSFTKRWHQRDQVILSVPMIHLGMERTHWAGRGKGAELHRQFLARRRAVESWEHERMPNPPVLQKPIAFSP